MIKPTVGRVVWYRNDPTVYQDGDDPCAAIVTRVFNDHMVNLAVFDSQGMTLNRISVTLRQPEDEAPNAPYCEWMPYQQAVAEGKIAPTLHAEGR